MTHRQVWGLIVVGALLLVTSYPPFALVQGGHEPGHQPPPDGSLAPVPGPTHVQRPAKGWSAGRVVSLVLGALMVFGGLGAAGAGITLAVLDQQARDADGFLTSPSETLSSDGFAVVSEDARIHTGGTLGRLPDRLVGDVKLSAERTGGAEVFLGIGPSADVTTYLAGVRHDTLLEAPAGGPVYRSADGGAPSKGPANAPVTIIEFSDYECPFCKRAEPTVEQVVAAYPDKVRLVYRHYPLPFHKSARPAAEAAACANAQGKFWEYHAKLFQNQNQLGADKLAAYADEVGLDKAKFSDCLAKKPYTAAIDKDLADGQKVGVNGTPAFFINGRMLSGAQPFDKFKEIIDDELASKG